MPESSARDGHWYLHKDLILNTVIPARMPESSAKDGHRYLHNGLIPNTVIPARMPESSAKDGNVATLSISVSPEFHIPVTGFRHPCRNGGAFTAF